MQQNRDLKKKSERDLSYQFMLRLKVPCGRDPARRVQRARRPVEQVRPGRPARDHAPGLPAARRAQGQPEAGDRRHRQRRLEHVRRLRRHQPQHHGAARRVRELPQQPGVPVLHDRVHEIARDRRPVQADDRVVQGAVARRREGGEGSSTGRSDIRRVQARRGARPRQRQRHHHRPPDRAALRPHLPAQEVQDRVHRPRRQLGRPVHQRHRLRRHHGARRRDAQGVQHRRRRRHGPHPPQGGDLRARGRPPRLRAQGRLLRGDEGDPRRAARPRQPRGARARRRRRPRPRASRAPSLALRSRAHSSARLKAHARQVPRARRGLLRQEDRAVADAAAVEVPRLDGVARAGRRQADARDQRRAGARRRLPRRPLVPPGASASSRASASSSTATTWP